MRGSITVFASLVMLLAACASEGKKTSGIAQGPEYSALCSALASDSSESVRISAAEALSKLGYLAANPPLSKAVVGDASAEVRRKAAEFMEKANDIDRDTDWRQTVSTEKPEATALITAATLDKDASVRAAACKALGKFRDKRIPGVLAEILAKDQSSDVRSAAAETIGILGRARP